MTKQELADKYNISTIGQAHKVLFDLYLELRDMLCGKGGFSSIACEKYWELKNEYISLYSILDTHPHTSQKQREEMRRQWGVLKY